MTVFYRDKATRNTFHKIVEMVVDNFVDDLRKYVIVALLHRFAQRLCKLKI